MAYRMLLATLLAAVLVPAWGAEAPQGLPEALTREVPAGITLPAGRYTAAKVWEAESSEFGHHVGRTVEDPDAEGGKAWEALVAGLDTPEDAPASGHVLFGPYATLEPGSYVAFFRVKILGDPEDESVADVDACVSYGADVLAVRELVASGLRRDAWAQVPIGFHYPGGKLECRMNWRGTVSLRVDRVTLFRVEGADLSSLSGKVDQPVPSGEPRDLAYPAAGRTGCDVFPRSSRPAPRVLVADLRKMPPDWQTCLTTLQGIVNRREPRVFYLLDGPDSTWLDHYRKRAWVKQAVPVPRPQDLVEQFRGEIQGMVITDPRLPATKNVATMIAGVRDGIVVSPRIARTLSLPVLDDLRGRWQTSEAAYRWALENLWERMSHEVAACLWPDVPHLRDYLVQHRIFIFWLPGRIDGARKYSRPDAEVRLVEELLAKMPANAPIMGYSWAGKDVGMGEGPGVTLFAEFGKYLVGSVGCANLSLHSGIPAGKPRQSHPPAPPLKRDKVHVAIILSDGDNLPVLTTHNFPPLWRSPERGRFPIGWTISPSARLLIPGIVDYYYSGATRNDYFLTGVSGIGYAYPDHYGERFREADRGRVYDDFLAQTGAAMAEMDLQEAWIMGITRPELIRRYVEKIPALRALYPDYGRRVTTYEDAVYPSARGVPVFHGACGWREDATREEQIAGVVAQIRQMTPRERPAFLHLFVWNWGFDLPMLQEVLKQLGPDYVAVRPDHLGMLYRQDLARQQVLVRLPATLSVIEGQPVTFDGSLHNATGKPAAVRVRAAAGLERAAVRPEEVQLPVDEMRAFSLSGSPAGKEIAVEVEGAFGSRRHTVECAMTPRAEIAGTIPEGARLRFVRLMEADTLSHRSGAVLEDPAASGKRAWSAAPGAAEAGYVVFGPYVPTPPGEYLALFRVKRTGDGEGVVALLDTAVTPPVEQTSQRVIRVDDLPKGEYRSFPLLFRHPGGPLETRVQWSGSAALAIDTITVWRIER